MGAARGFGHEANGTDVCVPPPVHSGALDFSLAAHEQMYVGESKSPVDTASDFEVALY